MLARTDAVTADDATEIRCRVLGIVYGVDEDASPLGSLAHDAIYRRRRCRHDPPGSVNVSLDELPTDDFDTGLLDLRPDVGRDDGDTCACSHERLDFAGSNGAAANDHHCAARQVEKRWKHHAHTDAGTFSRDPTTRSKSASDRPICVGAARRSRMTSAVL